jgi:hypothetical protein
MRLSFFVSELVSGLLLDQFSKACCIEAKEFLYETGEALVKNLLVV